MRVPLKPLLSVETKCFVGLLNAALWTLNFKQELGSKESPWAEEMEESTGDPCVTLGESLQCSTSQLVPWFVGWDVYTYCPHTNGARVNFYSLQQDSRTLCLCQQQPMGPSLQLVLCLGAELGPWSCSGFVGGFAGFLILAYPDGHLCCFLFSLSPPFLISGNCGNKGTIVGGWIQFVQAKLYFWKPVCVLGVGPVSPHRFSPQTSLYDYSTTRNERSSPPCAVLVKSSICW